MNSLIGEVFKGDDDYVAPIAANIMEVIVIDYLFAKLRQLFDFLIIGCDRTYIVLPFSIKTISDHFQ